MSNKIGTCRLCGCTGILSPEHFVPQCIGNKVKLKLRYAFSDIEENYNRGVCFYTLCKKCNNGLSDYAQAFQPFYYQIRDLLETNSEFLNLENIFPLRVLKQLFACFVGISAEGFNKKFEDLASFLKEKEKKEYNQDKYKIYLGIIKNKNLFCFKRGEYAITLGGQYNSSLPNIILSFEYYFLL